MDEISNFGLQVQLFGEGAKRGADQASDRQPVVQYPQLGFRLLPFAKTPELHARLLLWGKLF